MYIVNYNREWINCASQDWRTWNDLHQSWLLSINKLRTDHLRKKRISNIYEFTEFRINTIWSTFRQIYLTGATPVDKLWNRDWFGDSKSDTTFDYDSWLKQPKNKYDCTKSKRLSTADYVSRFWTKKTPNLTSQKRNPSTKKQHFVTFASQSVFFSFHFLFSFRKLRFWIFFTNSPFRTFE